MSSLAKADHEVRVRVLEKCTHRLRRRGDGRHRGAERVDVLRILNVLLLIVRVLDLALLRRFNLLGRPRLDVPVKLHLCFL